MFWKRGNLLLQPASWSSGRNPGWQCDIQTGTWLPNNRLNGVESTSTYVSWGDRLNFWLKHTVVLIILQCHRESWFKGLRWHPIHRSEKFSLVSVGDDSSRYTNCKNSVGLVSFHLNVHTPGKYKGQAMRSPERKDIPSNHNDNHRNNIKTIISEVYVSQEPA